MHTVLVICADATTFEAIAQHFPPTGWMVERAANAAAALRVAAADPPDLAVLHPSASNAPDTLQRLRDALEFADTPIISLVGEDRGKEVDATLPPAPTPAIVLPLPIETIPFQRAVQALVGSEAASSMPGGADGPGPGLAAMLGDGDDDAPSSAGAAPLDAAEFEEDELEVEVIELAVGEPAGEDAAPGSVPPRRADEPAEPPPAAPADVAYADTGEFPRDVERAVVGELAPGPRYQRTLTRALILREDELLRATSQRDKARDAFVRLRERAQSLDQERERALEQLKRAGKEIVRLRSAISRSRASASEAPTVLEMPAFREDGAAGDAPTEEALPPTAAEATTVDAPPPGDGPPPVPPASVDDEASARLARAVAELGDAREELDRAWRECDELTVRLGEVEDRLRQSEAAALAAEDHQREAEAERDARRKEAETAAGTLAAREEALGKLRAELDDLRERFDERAEALAQTERDLRTRTDELAEATSALEAARAELEDTRRQRDEARARAADAEQGGASVQERLQDQAEAVDELERKVAVLEEELEGARADALRWESKASRLTASLDVARAEAESWRDERERLLADLTAARERLSSAVQTSDARPRRPGGPAPLVVDSDEREAPGEDDTATAEELDAEGDLAEALRAADQALSRAERRGPSRRGDERDRGEDDSRRAARDEALEAQRARNELLQMEIEIARQQLKEAQEAVSAREAASLRQDDRRLSSAVALAENRLGELPSVRTSGQERQQAWQSLLTRIGVQMSQIMKACADAPALRQTGVKPEQLFQALKTLATESAGLFSDRRFILDREETVLRLIRDKLRDAQGLPTGQPIASSEMLRGDGAATSTDAIQAAETAELRPTTPAGAGRGEPRGDGSGTPSD